MTMIRQRSLLPKGLTIFCLLPALTCAAATRYVWKKSPSPSPPYTNWVTAAHTIQEAVDVAQPSDTVLVTNGVYGAGGRPVVGLMTNRVVINKPIVVRSVNGPAVTKIVGAEASGSGFGAIRCAYVSSSAILSGFCLTNGHTLAFSDPDTYQNGGGVYCENGGIATNCIILGNTALYGGGAFQGRLYNCVLAGNSAGYGGGAWDGTLQNCNVTGNVAGYGGGVYGSNPQNCFLHNCTVTSNAATNAGGGVCSGILFNCTLTGNRADYGGGVSDGILRNCIVYYNTAPLGANYADSTLDYSCTTPLPVSGLGNITEKPQLASATHLATTSPCIGAGSASHTLGVDIDGEAWANPPCMGADQFHAGQAGGSLSVALEADYTQVAVGFSVGFRARIEGRTMANIWDFGDGTVVSNRPYATHSWDTPGTFSVRLTAYNETYPQGISATVAVQMVEGVYHVNAASTNPIAPYSTWATAARTIQKAVNAANVPGALVLVTNGLYATGGRSVDGRITNRVAIVKPLTVRSVNGPEVTVICGAAGEGGGNDDGAIRCAYLAQNAVLSGFALTNGHTWVAAPDTAQNGGGAWCEDGAVLTNCVLINNSAYYQGGGVYGGIVSHCTLKGNSAYEGGAVHGYCTLSSCILAANEAYYGGGASYSTLLNCTLTGNSATNYGGGAYYSTLHHCTIGGNLANEGGGTGWSSLHRCILTTNRARYSGGGSYSDTLYETTLIHNRADENGGGAYDGTLSNCTVTANSAEYGGGGTYYGALLNCVLVGNVAGDDGGGAYWSTLHNCTLTENRAGSRGGGAYFGNLYNSIVYYNTARSGANYLDSTFEYSCTTPLPASGSGNISKKPQLASATHLAATSPCIGAGSASYASGLDIDGEPWLNPPCMGADQFVRGGAESPLSVEVGADHTTVVIGFPVSFRGAITGQTTLSLWDFGDGSTLANRISGVSHSWTNAGTYSVRLTVYNDAHHAGISATVTVQVVEVPVFYVNHANPAPRFPYQTWATAAKMIQDAVAASPVAGRWIFVTNGIYDTGGVSASGSLLTNRVTLTNGVVVRSVNGPDVTIIRGAAPWNTNGDGAVRCAFLSKGSMLAGFTLTNGHTRATGDTGRERSGGGVWGEGSGVVSNCVLIGNHAMRDGGAADSAVLYNCALTANSAGDDGGGADDCILHDCSLASNTAQDNGGGADESILHRCTLAGNFADTGGGVDDSTLLDCSLVGNHAVSSAGGASGSTLTNCTLSANSASRGGGASGSFLHNCTLTGNSATNSGGGVHESELNNCALSGNLANYGGGSCDSVLRNCTVTRNSANNSGGGVCDGKLHNCTVTGNLAVFEGGGAFDANLTNCIVYWNTALIGANYSDVKFGYSCTTPLPTNGPSNIDQDPRLASASHLSASSPCIGAGSKAAASGVDIDGEPWANPPCMGADQLVVGASGGSLSVKIKADYTQVAAGAIVGFRAAISGKTTASRWDFGNGVVLSNQPYANHVWNEPGSYTVRLAGYNETYPGGIWATVVVQVLTMPVHYVNAANPTPVFPYTSWDTAARTIQEAVDAAPVPGRVVWVTNGVYETGGRLSSGTITNRVALTTPVTVRSANGPETTIIVGAAPASNGLGAVRCAFVGSGAVLSGFTLTNGHTRSTGSFDQDSKGGGILGDGSGTVTNCILTGNWAVREGGGADSVRLHNCTITSNSASYGGGAFQSLVSGCTLTGNKATSTGGGAQDSDLRDCTLNANAADYGGGAYQSIITGCTLSGNSALNFGGGAYKSTIHSSLLRTNRATKGGGAHSSTLYGCRLMANTVYHDGGGAHSSTLHNCVLSGNYAADDGGGADSSKLYNCTLSSNRTSDNGGGASESRLRNCIVYFNTSALNQGYANCGLFCSVTYSCTIPPPEGVGNITNQPAFVDHDEEDFRLRPNSPCINAGLNADVTSQTDLDDSPRIVGGTVDMGAYEFQNPSSPLSYAWLQQYEWPTDGTADSADPDGDGLNNEQEWRCGTDPTNALSALRLLPPTLAGSHVIVRWESVTGIKYQVDVSTNLSAPGSFQTLATNVLGTADSTTFWDLNGAGEVLRFYRLSVPKP